MSNDEPMCECGHELSGHYKHGCNEVERGPDYEQCHCEQFTDARLAELRAEIADLRKDRDRLDAMIQHRWFVGPGLVYPTRYVVRDSDLTVIGQARATPREAIDKAIAAAESK